MIRYRRSIVPPVLARQVTSADRLSLRISYTLRLGPKPDQLSLPIVSESNPYSDEPKALGAPKYDQS